VVAFRSRFQNDNQLKAAAESDPAHVGEIFNPVGNHVRLIKEALNAWAEKQDPALGLKPLPVTNVFDKATGDRVALYKSMHEPPILNFQNKIDRIVGKKTVVALDLELPAVDEKPEVLQIVDVVVRYQGAASTRPLLENDVLPTRFIKVYLEKHLLANDRALHRFGSLTNTVRDKSAALIADHVRKVEDITKGKSVGKICIWGSSSGGRNALDLAAALSRKGFPLAYVGVLDAFFSADETRDVPTLTTKPTPSFRLHTSIQTNESDNFFQTVGNHKKITRQGAGFLFTSDMKDGNGNKTEEIHGSIPPLRDRDTTRQISSGASDDDAHSEVINQNSDAVRSTIGRILNEA